MTAEQGFIRAFLRFVDSSDTDDLDFGRGLAASGLIELARAIASSELSLVTAERDRAQRACEQISARLAENSAQSSEAPPISPNEASASAPATDDQKGGAQ